jgi:RNA polymerase sigma-70 factor (ECF subfamily)
MSLAIDWPWQRRAEDPMRYLDDVFRYAMSRLNDREEAEDIAIEVVQSLPSPCSRRDLRIYMIGMAHRKVVNRFRRQRPVSALRESDGGDRFETKVERAALVSTVLENMTEEHREVLTLKYVAGLSSSEIGHMLGKSNSAIYSQLQRARVAFAQDWISLTKEEVTL